MWRMFGISVLVLFLEMFLIRWISTEINIFAYLQNAVLVLCLFALGAGCLKPSRRANLHESFLILGMFLLFKALPFSSGALNKISVCLGLLHDFVVWNQLSPSDRLVELPWLGLGLLSTIMLSIFIFTMVAPFGQVLADAFKSEEKPLKLYSANILGSLVGILLFAALGAASAHPLSWLVVLVMLAFPFIVEEPATRTKNLLACGFLLVSGVLGRVLDPSIETRWSPYQKLTLRTADSQTEYVVEVNNSGYQQIQDNSRAPEGYFSNYNLPSRFKKSARNVLVVGAGTGNDVAGALKGTQGDVVAVEIDPVIVEFGRRFHPEHPYQSPRVTVVNTDARAFFERSNEKFDLIIFGLLDSHTTTSLTNARLDHFVYTRESIAAARKLLAEGGVFALIFDPQREFLVQRLAKTLQQVFSVSPTVVQIPGSSASWGGHLFLTGDGQAIERALAEDTDLATFVSTHSRHSDWSESSVETTSDDWPYLYLDSRRIPLLFVLLGFVFLVVWLRAKRSYDLYSLYQREHVAESLHFVGMGTAFTLLEVFGINRAAILFGNTWYTNCAVISGVLGMILLSNAVVLRYPTVPKSVGYVGILLTLVGLWVAPFDAFMSYSLPLKVIAVMVVCGAPMLFSGIVFARSFDVSVNRPRALSANLFGALIGGVLQSSSFAIGIKALLLLVGLFYGIAMVADTRVAARSKAR